MRFDVVFSFLVEKFVQRLADFFHHWYWHVFLIFKKWADSCKKWPVVYGLAVLILAVVYIVWALIPLWLVVRVVIPEELFKQIFTNGY